MGGGEAEKKNSGSPEVDAGDGQCRDFWESVGSAAAPVDPGPFSRRPRMCKATPRTLISPAAKNRQKETADAKAARATNKSAEDRKDTLKTDAKHRHVDPSAGKFMAVVDPAAPT